MNRLSGLTIVTAAMLLLAGCAAPTDAPDESQDDLEGTETADQATDVDLRPNRPTGADANSDGNETATQEPTEGEDTSGAGEDANPEQSDTEEEADESNGSTSTSAAPEEEPSTTTSPGQAGDDPPQDDGQGLDPRFNCSPDGNLTLCEWECTPAELTAGDRVTCQFFSDNQDWCLSSTQILFTDPDPNDGAPHANPGTLVFDPSKDLNEDRTWLRIAFEISESTPLGPWILHEFTTYHLPSVEVDGESTCPTAEDDPTRTCGVNSANPECRAARLIEDEQAFIVA